MNGSKLNFKTNSKPATKKTDVRKSNVQGLPEFALRLREEWAIEQPELHKMPKWLKPAISNAIKRGELPTNRLRLYGDWWALQHAKEQLGDQWIDHAGRVKLPDGKQLFVSEPYGLTDAGLRELNEFCRVLRLTYDILPRSWWYPSRTIRIEIRRVEDE